jgi:hypothetical protein
MQGIRASHIGNVVRSVLPVPDEGTLPKLRPTATKRAQQQRIEGELGKFKEGTLHSGSKKGPKVTNRKQAIAIALSEAGIAKRDGVRTATKKKKAAR